MKNTVRILLAGTTLALSATALADAPVRIKTEGLPTHMRAQLEAAAQQGPVALRQYLQRTRMVGYNLRIEEVARDTDIVGITAKAEPVAPAKTVTVAAVR